MNPRRSFVLVAAALATAVTLWPSDAAAQRRIVRRGPGTRVSVGVGLGFGYPVYGYPVFAYPYFYDPFWWGFDSYQFRYPYPYPYYTGAEVRIQVQPKQAEVYIDGYLVGTVDEFDGVFQRLDVPLGEHEITIYAPGYRTYSQRMLFRPRQTYHIKNVLQPLPAGEQPETRPAPSARPEGQEPPGPPPPQGRPPRGGERRPPRDVRADRFGTLSVRVQPADAEIAIDGERWEAPGGERIVVELSEGTHRIEVRKAGFRTYTSTVTVRAGETTTLNVSLPQ